MVQGISRNFFYSNNTRVENQGLAALSNKSEDETLPLWALVPAIAGAAYLALRVLDKISFKRRTEASNSQPIKTHVADTEKMWREARLPEHARRRWFPKQEPVPYKVRSIRAQLYWLIADEVRHRSLWHPTTIRVVREGAAHVRPIDLLILNGPLNYPYDFNVIPQGSVIFPAQGTLEASEYRDSNYHLTGQIYIKVIVCTQDKSYFSLIRKEDLEKIETDLMAQQVR